MSPPIELGGGSPTYALLQLTSLSPPVASSLPPAPLHASGVVFCGEGGAEVV